MQVEWWLDAAHHGWGNTRSGGEREVRGKSKREGRRTCRHVHVSHVRFCVHWVARPHAHPLAYSHMRAALRRLQGRVQRGTARPPHSLRQYNKHIEGSRDTHRWQERERESPQRGFLPHSHPHEQTAQRRGGCACLSVRVRVWLCCVRIHVVNT